MPAAAPTGSNMRCWRRESAAVRASRLAMPAQIWTVGPSRPRAKALKSRGGETRSGGVSPAGVLVVGVARDTYDVADLLDAVVGVAPESQGCLALLLIHPFGATTLAASSACCHQPCLGPLPNQVSLKLGQRRKEVEDQPAARGGRVELLLEATKASPALVQRLDRLNQVRQRSSQPIQLPHHQRIAGPAGCERGLEPRSVAFDLAGRIREALLTPLTFDCAPGNGFFTSTIWAISGSMTFVLSRCCP